MDLRDLKRHWNALGEIDPLFAILTDPRFKNNKWEVGEFFRTGGGWVDELLLNLKALGVSVGGGRCLDFGCGVGRLTQALCRHFEVCDGVDIAPSMIQLARTHNRLGERCRYHVNEVNDLELFPDRSFDFVCSLLVLQHIEPCYAKRYISEFIRVLKPGGIAAFQLPSTYLGGATLPDSAYRASIIPSCPRLTTTAGQPVALNVTVRNESDVTWPEHAENADDFARLRLGNHWLDRQGNMLKENDGRANLPQALLPRQEIVVPLIVVAPDRQGDYLLEIDLVAEGVTWFARRGVRAARVEVRNRPAHRSLAGLGRRMLRILAPVRHGPSLADVNNPFMEIHCVPRDEVVRTLEVAGGRVLHQVENNWCGGGFDSVLYVATRDGG
jgi:SAM-dependent methyltransferase